MFLFSIMPIPLSRDSNPTPHGKPGSIQDIEDQIQRLESLITGLKLNPNGSMDEVSGLTFVDSTGKRTADLNVVQAKLNDLMAKDIVLRNMSGDTGDRDPVTRLAEINSKISVAEQRKRDLEVLITQLTLNPNSNVSEVSGITYIDNGGHRMADVNVVRDALSSAKTYEEFLETQKSFWEKITGSSSKIISPPVMVIDPVTIPQNGDINGNGKLDKDDQKLLHKFLKGKITLTDEQKKAADLDGNGEINRKDVHALNKIISRPDLDNKKLLEKIKSLSNMLIMEAQGKILAPSFIGKKEELYLALAEYTGKEVTSERKNAIEEFLSSIRNGKPHDPNQDGELNYKDILKIWKTGKKQRPPEPNPRKELLNQIKATADQLIANAKGQIAIDWFIDPMPGFYKALAEYTGKEITSEKTKAIKEFLKSIKDKKATDPNNDKELNYKDFLYIWNHTGKRPPKPIPLRDGGGRLLTTSNKPARNLLSRNVDYSAAQKDLMINEGYFISKLPEQVTRENSDTSVTFAPKKKQRK